MLVAKHPWLLHTQGVMSAKQKIKSGFSRFLPSVRLRKHEGLEAYTNTLDEASNKLTPNLRALRLAIAVSDQLLSMDVAANGVVSRALDITEAYCDHPVHVDIISNVIMLSQLRGVDKEPLTLIRPSVMRDTNNMTVQLIQQLVHDIRAGKYSLDEAEAKLDSILKNPVTYPAWLVSTGNAGIAAAVSLFFTTNWRVVLVTFAIALGVDRLLALMAKRAIPPFFRQAGAAVFIVLAAALVAQLDKHGVGFFSGMNPTLIVVGGIFMLVAGLVIVAAIRDAIEEYYVTANARLLKVVMQTTGIVVGILTGLPRSTTADSISLPSHSRRTRRGSVCCRHPNTYPSHHMGRTRRRWCRSHHVRCTQLGHQCRPGNRCSCYLCRYRLRSVFEALADTRLSNRISGHHPARTRSRPLHWSDATRKLSSG